MCASAGHKGCDGGPRREGRCSCHRIRKPDFVDCSLGCLKNEACCWDLVEQQKRNVVCLLVQNTNKLCCLPLHVRMAMNCLRTNCHKLAYSLPTQLMQEVLMRLSRVENAVLSGAAAEMALCQGGCHGLDPENAPLAL